MTPATCRGRRTAGGWNGIAGLGCRHRGIGSVVRFRPRRHTPDRYGWVSRDFDIAYGWGSTVRGWTSLAWSALRGRMGPFGEWAEAKLIWWERPRPWDQWTFAADIRWRHVIDLEIDKAREGLARLAQCVAALEDDRLDAPPCLSVAVVLPRTPRAAPIQSGTDRAVGVSMGGRWEAGGPPAKRDLFEEPPGGRIMRPENRRDLPE